MLLFRRIPGLVPFAAVVALSLPPAAALAAPPTPAAVLAAPSGPLQRLVEAPALKVAGIELEAEALRPLYRARAFQPIWHGERREVLLAKLAEADGHGLDQRAYHLAAIKTRLGAEGDKAAELDLLLSDAALRYARDLRLGRVDPAAAEQDWDHARPSFDAAAFLTRLAKGEAGPALQDLAPPYGAYVLLREALAKYRALRDAGGWPKVPAGTESLKPGMEDDRVPAVRARLAVTGEYDGADMDSRLYDDALVAAVQRFQARHGLEADGVIGRGTLATLNVPVESRIAQIAANMERWRWLPRSLEKRHLAVNIASQTLESVEDGMVALSTRVIVGKPIHKTVSFRATIASVTINPPWRVPASIASKEILPELKKNPGYLVANNLKILGFEPGTPQAEGIGIDWASHSNFPYQLRQDPGEDNSLGRIKFNMPNGHDIYLHDTPARTLFGKARRAFSHGCVRVEEPLRLAAQIIGKPEVTAESLQALVDAGETQQVHLRKPLPVYLFYFTAWVDADGLIQFRDDIYGYDKSLAASLSRARSKTDLLAKG